MDKAKILLGLAAGGYWVYLAQSNKITLSKFEYYAGLGVGAYWAWLALSSPKPKQLDVNITEKKEVATPPAPIERTQAQEDARRRILASKEEQMHPGGASGLPSAGY
jgi:hypothetical protein